MLKKCAQSLHRVINNAVQLSKNQGMLELMKEATNVEHLVQEVVDEFQNFADCCKKCSRSLCRHNETKEGENRLQ